MDSKNTDRECHVEAAEGSSLQESKVSGSSNPKPNTQLPRQSALAEMIAAGSVDPDPDLMCFIADDEDTLQGTCYHSDSDEESNGLEQESVQRRNVYVQATQPGTLTVNSNRLSKLIRGIKERHDAEISQNKKTQWCCICSNEAFYPCCGIITYCSLECQQLHWIKGHKLTCKNENPV